MKNTIKFCLFVSLLAFHTIKLGAEETLPVEAFASLPDVSNVKLSPDGTKVASLVRIDAKSKQGTGVSIFDTKTKKQSLPLYTNNDKFVITRINWANDKKLLISAKFPAVRYGTPTTETRLVILDLETQKLSHSLSKSFMRRLSYVPQIQSNIIDYLPDDPDHVLLELSGVSPQGDPNVYKLALDKSGKTRTVQHYKRNVRDWITDTQGKVRIGIYKKKTQYKIMEQKENNGDLRELWSFEAFSEDEVWPLGFDNDPNILYVRALHKGRDAIFKVKLSDPKLELTLVHSNKNYDITAGLRYSNSSKRVVGVGSSFWDEHYKNIQKLLDEALPDNDNYLLNFSQDENHYIALSTSDVEPGVYLLGNVKTNEVRAIAHRYGKLVPEKLSKMKPVSYKARDGLDIEGYLTLPKNRDKNLPTVIFPHGGPISYDSDGFDYWTQFLASRGYAVLQMNFRGSHGYGFDFMKQGLQNWGQTMQDDVEDGTKWLIAEGVADPKRICILGASYGGYAALMGAVKTPDLYKCSVSFAGVTDLESLVKSSRRYSNFDIVKKQIGSDYDKLWEYSPLKHAEKIEIPVLLLHGTKDRIVRIAHSEKMLEELEDAKKQVEYVELENGDHHLSNNKHRLKAFKAIEKFLSEHL